MDYIRLPELVNTYPQPGNYIRQSKDKTALFGIYSDVNKLDFDLPNIDDIKIINNTTFRFILAIRKNKSDKDVKYYTSRRYLLDLRESQAEGNPYFSQFSLLPNYIVTVEWETFELLFGDLYPIEFKQGVLMSVNNSIQRLNPESEITSVNYELIGRYVDWLVSVENPDDLSSDGVIPAVGLGAWYEGKYNPVKGFFEFGSEELDKSQVLGQGESEDYGKKTFSSDPKVRYAPFGVKGSDLEFKQVERTKVWYYWNESLQFWQRYGLEAPPSTNQSGGSTNNPPPNTGNNSNNNPPVNNPPGQIPFPPIGRRGFYQDEEVRASDGNIYAWTNYTGGRWLFRREGGGV